MNHFIKRRRDQSAQPNHINVMLFGSRKDFFGRRHHSQINYIVVITAQNNGYNIFTDVVYIPFYRSKKNLCFGFGILILFLLLFNIRDQYCHTFFHDAGTLYHLWKKHFSWSKQIPNHVHAVHHRSFNYFDRLWIFLAGFFHILFDVICNPFYKGMFDAFFNRFFAPCILLRFNLAAILVFYFFCIVNQSFGSIIAPVQKYIFHQLPELGFDLFIHFQLTGIYDSHI